MALKEICDRLKIMGNELLNMELRKIDAVQGEDFESAKALKF